MKRLPMPAGKSPGRKRVPPRKSRGGRPVGGAGVARAKAWQQAADRLEKEIAGGRFQSTGRLPTESHLARELLLTRHTLRRAIAALVAKGVLRAVPHGGTFIAPSRIQFTIGATTRFVEALRTAGISPGIRLVSRRTCTPPADIAKLLGVAVRTQVIEIIHVFSANQQPLGFVVLWVPADRFARVGEMVEATGSLRRALAQLGVSYKRKWVEITSRHAEPGERALLALGADAVVLGIDGVSADSAGEQTHAFRWRLDADRVALVVEPAG